MKHLAAAGIWDDNRSAVSLGTSGYQKLPSGLILQWGTTTPSSGTATVTFPIAFPTACVCVNANPLLASTPTTTIISSVLMTMSKTGCTIAGRAVASGLSGAQVSNAPIYWHAIGY